jgi:hypothetical protein
MGVNAEYLGHVGIVPSVNQAEYDYLHAFARSRRSYRPGGPIRRNPRRPTHRKQQPRGRALQPDCRRTAASEGLRALSELPIERHELPPLLLGAWTLRNELRLVDGLYVELARRLGTRLITTDLRLARAVPIAETIS